MNLKEVHKIYFLGIGGIGMSALARYFHQRGIKVSGYDKTATPLTKELSEEGIDIHFDETTDRLSNDIDLVIYTPAIPRYHVAFEWIEKNGIPLKKRAEVLGMISRSQRTIAIAGTHGKTTTSTILTHLLHESGIDCTAFLGGIAKNFDSNYVTGKSDWVVVEADEYDRSFLHLSPDIAVVLSADPDHLDIYGSHENMIEVGFRRFLDNVSHNGTIFIHNELVQLFDNQNIKTFGLENGDIAATQIKVIDGGFHFECWGEKFWTPLPGRHNVENAVAAMSVARELGATIDQLRAGMKSFKGIRRRFEFIIRYPEFVFINDYAHHPTELQASIGAAKELFPDKKITGVFQPHLYSRTQDFQDGFAKALDMLDECILMSIYPAREKPIPGVLSNIIFDKMQLKNKELVEDEDVVQAIKNKKPEVLMMLGAGDLVDFIHPIIEALR